MTRGTLSSPPEMGRRRDEPRATTYQVAPSSRLVDKRPEIVTPRSYTRPLARRPPVPVRRCYPSLTSRVKPSKGRRTGVRRARGTLRVMPSIAMYSFPINPGVPCHPRLGGRPSHGAREIRIHHPARMWTAASSISTTAPGTLLLRLWLPASPLALYTFLQGTLRVALICRRSMSKDTRQLCRP